MRKGLTSPALFVAGIAGLLAVAMLPASCADSPPQRLRSARAHTVDTGNIVGPKAPPAVAPAPLGPADHFGDGIFEVLVDIKPGEYKTAGPPPGAVVPPVRCYWARLKDTRGEITSLLASDYGNAGPNIVTISPSDKAFESRGCGEWRLQR